MDWVRASPVFALTVVATLALTALIGIVLLQPELVAGLLGQQMAGHIGGHFREPHHRVHDLAFGSLFGTGVLGMLAQLRRPSRNVAGQLMALIPWAALLLTSVLTVRWVFAPLPIFAALTLLATILHPSGRDLLASFGLVRVNRVMLGMVVLAAVPLLVFASTNLQLQSTLTDDHAALGHYGFMAAFGITVIAIGVLASLRPDGWWLPAWVAGGLAAGLGLASLLFSAAGSSLGVVWSLAAIAWGVLFVVIAEVTQDAERPTPLGSWRAQQRARWWLPLSP